MRSKVFWQRKEEGGGGSYTSGVVAWSCCFPGNTFADYGSVGVARSVVALAYGGGGEYVDSLGWKCMEVRDDAAGSLLPEVCGRLTLLDQSRCYRCLLECQRICKSCCDRSLGSKFTHRRGRWRPWLTSTCPCLDLPTLSVCIWVI